MAYYRGDYYPRGDYYRGDFWSSLKKTVGNIGEAVSNPLGYAEKKLFGSGHGPPPAPAGPMAVSPNDKPPGVMPLIKRTKQFITGGGTTPPPPMEQPERDTGRRIRWDKKKQAWVYWKRRHLNPLNVKALRRADRRARGFLRISKSITRHYVAKQPKGRAYIHARKRKRA